MMERVRNPLLSKAVPKGVDRIDPSELISQAVMGSSAPRLSMPRRDPNDVPEPTFDAKKSRLASILGVTGAIAAALSPDSTAGAVGSGLAAGGAGVQQDLKQTFLANQEQAAKISEAIRERNREIDDMELKANVDLSKERLRHGFRTERDEVLHQQDLAEIDARAETDLERAKALEKYKRGLPMTEKEREDLDIDRYRAETSRLQEERLRGGGGGGGESIIKLQERAKEVDRDLRTEESRAFPDRDRIDLLRARKNTLESDVRNARLSQSFPNIDVSDPSPNSLVDAAERYIGGNAPFNDVVKLANTALEQGRITSEEFERFFRTLARSTDGTDR